MTHPGVAALLSRRSTLAGSVSLALHGGLLLLAVVLVGARVAPAPHQIALTMVEIVAPSRPSPAPAPEPAAPVPAIAPAPAPRAPARPAPAAPARATSIAEALDLKVSYSARDNFASNPSTEAPADGESRGFDAGRLINTDSRRQLEDSLAHLDIPAPPRVSLARPPHEKRNSHQLRLPSVRRFAGMHMKLVLTIDAQGRVSHVELIQGIDGQLDLRVVGLARHFEFDPALDDDGAPTPGTSRWDIEIIDDDHGQLRNAMERGYY